VYREIIVIYYSTGLILKDFIDHFLKRFRCNIENVNAVNLRV